MPAERHLRVVPDTNLVTRSIRIAAPPEIVFSYFVNPDKHILWQGTEAELDPVPGGAFRVTFAPGYVAAGTYLEVSAPARLVYTWGWEDAGSDLLAPGTSTVTVTLDPDDDGTIVTVVHTGLPDTMTEFHSQGWDESLTELARRLADG